MSIAWLILCYIIKDKDSPFIFKVLYYSYSLKQDYKNTHVTLFINLNEFISFF